MFNSPILVVIQYSQSSLQKTVSRADFNSSTAKYYVVFIIKWLKEGIILGTTKEIKFMHDFNSQRLKSFIRVTRKNT